MTRCTSVLLGALSMALATGASAQEDDRAAERARMVQEISGAAARRSAPPTSSDGIAGMPMGTGTVVSDADKVSNPRVLDAMRRIPRHVFVPAEMQREAYVNRPLPIGFGQTISQPLIVGMMTELLNPQPGSRILEVGTGSGYQAAVLTAFTPDVYTIEIVDGLHQQARAKLQKFGLGADRVIQGDGYFGLEKAAPFDGIIVTAAADHIPPPLIQQLKPGGRMVIPIGPVHATQRLVVVEKDASGKVRSRSVHPVKFVPLTGGPRGGAEQK